MNATLPEESIVQSDTENGSFQGAYVLSTSVSPAAKTASISTGNTLHFRHPLHPLENNGSLGSSSSLFQIDNKPSSTPAPEHHQLQLQDEADVATVPPFSARQSALMFLKSHWLVLLYSFFSLFLLILLVHLSFFAARMEDGSLPETLGCRSWAFANDCGLWGINCRPFESNWTAFRCPTRCAWDQSASLTVYGSGPYRADSRICRAAIHAGVLGDNGGCALMRFAGEATSFQGSKRNGVKSRTFSSWFPKTIEFQAAPSQFCTDLSWLILAVGVASIGGFAMLPTRMTDPLFLYMGLMVWGFFYVRLIGQPRSVDYDAIATRSLADVFVVIAACYSVYQLAPVHSFRGWNRMKRKKRLVLWGLLYVLPFNLMLHMNFIAFVPWLDVGFGGYNNENVNAGTFLVFGSLGIALLYAAFWLCRQLFRQQLWKKYLLGYVLVISAVLLSWAVFYAHDFHLHHTMFAMLIVPLTRFQSPPAIILQSGALGAFIQGYAAWGWASYLTKKPIQMTIASHEHPPNVEYIDSTFVDITWDPLPHVVGYSLLLNGVEVYRDLSPSTRIRGLQPNLTYFISVAGVADYGETGFDSPEANFTTLAQRLDF